MVVLVHAGSYPKMEKKGGLEGRAQRLPPIQKKLEGGWGGGRSASPQCTRCKERIADVLLGCAVVVVVVVVLVVVVVVLVLVAVLGCCVPGLSCC